MVPWRRRVLQDTIFSISIIVGSNHNHNNHSITNIHSSERHRIVEKAVETRAIRLAVGEVCWSKGEAGIAEMEAVAAVKKKVMMMRRNNASRQRHLYLDHVSLQTSRKMRKTKGRRTLRRNSSLITALLLEGWRLWLVKEIVLLVRRQELSECLKFVSLPLRHSESVKALMFVSITFY